MKGYRVRRVWGWDGHGLPIENKVENKLQIKRKKDIEEKVGVKKFIEECKKYVNKISGEWEWYVDHIGRWVDFKNAYKTWDRDYMESVMWVFKQMYDKGYIYKGLRVLLYCPHCSTPISNFEVAMDNDNYRDVVNVSTTYKYKVKDEKNTYLLAWSTTPWTKLVTTALAINPKLIYIKVKQKHESFILALDRLDMLKDNYEVVDQFSGDKLVGVKFEPHYDFYKIDEDKRAFVVVPADYVTGEDGTGIVTLATYGEEDLAVMNKENIQLATHLDDEGKILDDTPKFGGMFYLDANPVIDKDLMSRGLIYHQEEFTHKMPHCWRCSTQLYYGPQDAWYVDVQSLKPQMLKTNEEVNWYPLHFKYGRFLESMESAPDWNISRNRYWGSPIPVWECTCGERFVPGSIKELEEESGQKITDLHKPGIDEIAVKCKKCGRSVKRVAEVLDSWIEAGSASFAERHYPFGNQGVEGEKLEDFFPPDFIVEYTGQIRAWFYVLHVIGAALFKSKAFKNVGVEGVILGTDGRKMSKNYGNYPDPKAMLQKYGADGLRLYLMGSPIMKGEDIIISEADYASQIKTFHLPLWNIVNYLVTYSGDMPKLETEKSSKIARSSANILDVWVVALLDKLGQDISNAFDKYDTTVAVKLLTDFIDNVSRWYVRRSRDRVDNTGEDRENFFHTLYSVVISLSTLSAPLTPFISEYLYRHLTGGQSVHLLLLPSFQKANHSVLADMDLTRQIVEAGHRVRKEANIKLRQPLFSLTISLPARLNYSLDNKPYMQILEGELNIKKTLLKKTRRDEIRVEYDTKMTLELAREGEARELIRRIQDERKKLGVNVADKVKITVLEIPGGFEDYVKKAVGAEDIKVGETFKVTK